MNKETLIHNHKKLSIQLSSDGFSFCIYNSSTQKYEHIVAIPFAFKVNTPASILEEVKNIFENNVLLHNTYEEVVFIHHNELNTFVPQAYFNENLLGNYLQNNVKVFDNDFVSFDELNNLEINNVYIPFVNVNNYIFDAVGEFTYLHSSTVFLQNILKSKNITDKAMFVNVYHQNFQLVVLENNKLLLSNHFTYQNKEDFAYYILFVAEQLNMDPNHFELWFYGNIQEKDDTFKLIYNYVRNVAVYTTLNPKLENSITSLPQAHFNLLQLHL